MPHLWIATPKSPAQLWYKIHVVYVDRTKIIPVAEKSVASITDQREYLIDDERKSMCVGVPPSTENRNTYVYIMLLYCSSILLAREYSSDISSSSIYRGELSFLIPDHFCICLRDSAVLTGYLFRQGPACVHVHSWKNVLGVSGVVSFAHNWKNVLCRKMSTVKAHRQGISTTCVFRMTFTPYSFHTVVSQKTLVYTGRASHELSIDTP